MDAVLDAAYFRDKAETCLRLTHGLSWNNPARGKLMELAEDFKRQAKQLEAVESAPHVPPIRPDRPDDNDCLIELFSAPHTDLSCDFRRLEWNLATGFRVIPYEQ
jgi:hypothetical protein